MLSQLFTLALAVTIVSADSGVPVFPRYFPLSNSTSVSSSSSSSSSSSFISSTTTIPAVTPNVVAPSTYTTLPYYANTTAPIASSAPAPAVSSTPVVGGAVTGASTTTTTSTITITSTGTITLTAEFASAGTTTVSVFYAHHSGADVTSGGAAPTSPVESGLVEGNGAVSPTATSTITINKTMTLSPHGTAVVAQGSVPGASGAAESGAPAVSSCPAPVTVYVTQPAEIKTVTVTEKQAYPSVGYHTKPAPYPTGSPSASSGGSTGFLTSYKSTGTAPIPAYSSSS